tara:strand:- start:5073 stop:6320 length:1248 start_codon:yes stop_codon:yes gene_type:complete
MVFMSSNKNKRQMADVDEQLEVLFHGADFGDRATQKNMEKELRVMLEQDRPLKVYAGFDPTSVDLHLGHTLPMRKLRQFQDFGHIVTFLIGNFTGLVGDPSDKDKTRPMLSADELAENAKTYTGQAFKILDSKSTIIKYNADWLSKLSFSDVVSLCSKFTVAQFLERDNFAKRWQAHNPVYLSEFMYAIMQAYDAVALKTDIQIGGSDQLFNLMAGRTLQKDAGLNPQVVITLPILVGTDGHERMSKSTGNSIGINDSPEDMFGKVMSIPDSAIMQYFTLLTALTPSEVSRIEKDLNEGSLLKMDAKKELALQIVKIFHGEKNANNAQEFFEATIQRNEIPKNILELVIAEPDSLSKILLKSSLVQSGGEVRRLTSQGAITVNGNVIDDFMTLINDKDEIRVGRHRFLRIRIDQQ